MVLSLGPFQIDRGGPIMPYREKRVHLYEQLELFVYPITVEERRQPRRKKKEQASREAQKALNDLNSRKHMRWIIHTNFVKGKDFYLTLTYSDENIPKTIEEAERNLSNYLKRINRLRKKMGLPNAKYIAVTEWHEGEKRTRIHHHIIIDGELSRDLLEDKWGKGRTNVRRLQPDPLTGYEDLANYLCKQPRTKKGKRRWKQSKGNLKKPDIRINDSKYSGRKVRKLAQCPEDPTEFEKIYKGYKFTSCKVMVNKMTDGIYLHVRMRKMQI